MLTAIIIIQLVVIGALYLGAIFSKRKSVRHSLWKFMAGCILLAGLGLSGIWIYPSYAGFYALCAIYVLLNIWRLTRPHADLDANRKFEVPFRGIIAVTFGALFIWQGIVGRIDIESHGIDLVSPLEPNAGHCVLSGGASTGVNLHYIVGPNGALNEEIHSIDFIKLRKGFRTVAGKSWHPKPLRPEDYLIYESPVYAPCRGTVISAEGQHPDVNAGFRFRSSNVNQVTLACDGVHVMLAHLRQGSISVEPGDAIEQGTKIGLVGNTGNTEEPHLHIHAFDPQTSGDNQPVPMQFENRFLARGDCL